MQIAGPVVVTLNQLIRLNQASERGFETAAEHVKNRGLKLYLKSYAEQRAQFTAELQREIKRWSGTVHIRRNPLAALHRGWIDLQAALTIGRSNVEQVVLREVLRGEDLALRTYTKARKTVLPVMIDELLADQASTIQDVRDHLCAMATCGTDHALLIQLYEDPDSAQQAVAQLAADGIKHEQIQTTPVTEIAAYSCQCHRQRLLESSSAGAISGLIAGMLVGLAISVPFGLLGTAPWLVSVAGPLLFGALAGLLGGVLFGLLIGQGITEDDEHFYQTTVASGGLIVAVQAAISQIEAVRQTLHAQRDLERQFAPA